VLPDSFFPARPRVGPLVVNYGEAGVQKLLGTLWHLERFVVHHQLLVAGNLEPGYTPLNVPAQPRRSLNGSSTAKNPVANVDVTIRVMR